MSQNFFTDIDENNDGGIDLANMLDDASHAIRTGHMGVSRPAYALPGTNWIKVSNINDLAAGLWEVKQFDGTQDITLFSIDPVNHKIIFGGNNVLSSYTVGRTDNLADVLEIFRSVNAVSILSAIYTQYNDLNNTVVFGRNSVKSTNVANGAETASYSIDLVDDGVLKEVFSLTSKGLLKSIALAGAGGSQLVATSAGELKRLTVNYQYETQFYKDTFILNAGSLYLVNSDFVSDVADFNNDLPNLTFISKDFTADINALDTGYTVSSSAALVDTSVIPLVGKKMEFWNIKSETTNITLNVLPFGNDPQKFFDGQVIKLVNVSDNQKISIINNNVDYGYVGNGSVELLPFQIAEFTYSAVLKRFLVK